MGFTPVSFLLHFLRPWSQRDDGLEILRISGSSEKSIESISFKTQKTNIGFFLFGNDWSLMEGRPRYVACEMTAGKQTDRLSSLATSSISESVFPDTQPLSPCAWNQYSKSMLFKLPKPFPFHSLLHFSSFTHLSDIPPKKPKPWPPKNPSFLRARGELLQFRHLKRNPGKRDAMRTTSTSKSEALVEDGWWLETKHLEGCADHLTFSISSKPAMA